MRPTRVPRLLCTAILLLGAAGAGSAQTTGYWRYVRTDTFVVPYSPGVVYPDSGGGTEGNFTLTQSGANVFPGTQFVVTFNWSRPPAILIPGTALYWPVSATVDTSLPQLFLGEHSGAWVCAYQTASNPVTSTPVPGPKVFEIDMSSGMSVGTVTSYNNALPAIFAACENMARRSLIRADRS